MPFTLHPFHRFPVQCSVTLIALIVTQLVVLTGCDLTRIWETYSSTREGPLPTPGIWDIQEPDRRLLLVMVHGFNSSNNQGWGEFPRIIKSEKDTAFSRFNVLRYEYGSAVCRNNADISDRGDGLKSFLSDELKNYDGMIILGHSLGGLVAMHGLIDLAKMHRTNLKRIPVTVMTFGTPHLGVEGAERLGQLGVLCIDKQAKDVEVFNRSSRELRKDWDSYFGSNDSTYRVTIRTFYGSDDSFVAQDSACGRFPECEQITPVNHVTIVKPSDTNHLAYTKLRVQVGSMIDQTLKQPGKESLPVPDTGPAAPPHRAESCGPVPFKTRSRARFVPRWVNHINTLGDARGDEEDYDLQNLMAVRREQRILVDEGSIPELILIQEALFTLKCLEKDGQLRTVKPDHPSMVGG